MFVDDPSHRLLFVMATDLEYGKELKRRIKPLMTGVGPIEAAIGTSRCLRGCVDAGLRPDLVVSLGSAGSRRCGLGTVAQVSRISWRDMDASRLGFEKGVTPFADHPAEIELPTPIDGVPTASLSTGSDVVGGTAWDGIEADLVDMETFAVVRACQRFDVPVIGLRGVSDGPGDVREIGGWARLLERLDEHLATAVDLLQEALDRLQGERRQGGMASGPDGEPAVQLTPLWNGDEHRGEQVMRDLQTLGTQHMTQVGPATYPDMLAALDMEVARSRAAERAAEEVDAPEAPACI